MISKYVACDRLGELLLSAKNDAEKEAYMNAIRTVAKVERVEEYPPRISTFMKMLEHLIEDFNEAIDEDQKAVFKSIEDTNADNVTTEFTKTWVEISMMFAKMALSRAINQFAEGGKKHE